jgi:hypothetical protein
VGLGVPLLLISIFLFVFWRRSKKKAAQAYAAYPPVVAEQKGSYVGTTKVGGELEGSQPIPRELEG